MRNRQFRIPGNKVTEVKDLAFEELIRKHPLIVGHNVAFDAFMMSCEMRRIYRTMIENPVFEPSFCTMHAMTPICKIPSPYGYSDFKWPKLEEAYLHCFGKKPEVSHDALADVHATAEIYRWIKNQKEPVPA